MSLTLSCVVCSIAVTYFIRKFVHLTPLYRFHPSSTSPGNQSLFFCTYDLFLKQKHSGSLSSGSHDVYCFSYSVMGKSQVNMEESVIKFLHCSLLYRLLLKAQSFQIGRYKNQNFILLQLNGGRKCISLQCITFKNQVICKIGKNQAW